MKNNILTVAILAATLIIGCKDKSTSKPGEKSENSSSIEIKKQNVGLYAKVTAVQCPPCGGWGWDLNNQISDAIGETAIPVSFYVTYAGVSKLQSGASALLASGINSFPSFVFNQVKASGSNTNEIQSEILSNANTFAADHVIMGLGGNVTWSGDELTLKWAVKAFENQSGDFTASAYIIEDGVMETQAGREGIVAHHHVLRGSVTKSTYGVNIDGNLDAGSTISLDDITYKVDSSWDKSNIEVIGVIWKKTSAGGYEFVNAARFK